MPLTIAACNTSKQRRRKEKNLLYFWYVFIAFKVVAVLMSGIQSTFDTKKNKTEIVVEAYLDCHDLQIKNRLRKKIAYWYLLQCTSIIFVSGS